MLISSFELKTRCTIPHPEAHTIFCTARITQMSGMYFEAWKKFCTTEENNKVVNISVKRAPYRSSKLVKIRNLVRDLLGQPDGHVAQHAFGGGIGNALESVL